MSDNLPQLSKSITEDLHNESMWDWDFLPPEILIQSLSLLPIKTLITCTSVSKTWKSLIQNPTFISTHLNRSKNNHLFLFRLCSKQLSEATRCNRRAPAEKELYKLFWDNNEDFNERTNFDFPFHGESVNGIFNVIGTCNGLVCLADNISRYAYKFILWNPCLRKFVRLPRPNVTFRTHFGYDAKTGFGFDTKTNDYKVARFVTPEWEGLLGKAPPEVEVYSLATGEWRIVTALAPIGAPLDQERQTFFNGALHWVAVRELPSYEMIYFIMVLDLGDEVLREIALPKLSEEDDYLGRQSLSAYGNSLALFNETDKHSLNIWVMKEYGVESSWTKVCTYAVSGFGYCAAAPRGIAFRRSGEVILENLKEQLFSCDLESQKSKDLGITGYGYTFAGSYVESLVLLDKPDRAFTY
uniref:F-box domain-containing protein n=1 Tax=Fagus sylvatica TaxID=28930 RepID=A0A2N9GG03_FAGSY